jgi:hypothetical protein
MDNRLLSKVVLFVHHELSKIISVCPIECSLLFGQRVHLYSQWCLYKLPFNVFIHLDKFLVWLRKSHCRIHFLLNHHLWIKWLNLDFLKPLCLLNIDRLKLSILIALIEILRFANILNWLLFVYIWIGCLRNIKLESFISCQSQITFLMRIRVYILFFFWIHISSWYPYIFLINRTQSFFFGNIDNIKLIFTSVS